MKEPVWIDQLESAVKNSICRSDVLRILGLTTNGSGNHRIVQKWINNKNIDTSHFDFRKAQGRKLSSYTSTSFYGIKLQFKKNSVYKCVECGITDTYNNKPITLQLDHINGIRTDNTIENLRWLCPNCHTQTDTYGSKRLRGIYSSNKKTKNTTSVGRNGDRIITRKVIRPSAAELNKLIEQYNWSAIGRMFGVSDNAVRKWAKRYKILDH